MNSFYDVINKIQTRIHQRREQAREKRNEKVRKRRQARKLCHNLNPTTPPNPSPMLPRIQMVPNATYMTLYPLRIIPMKIFRPLYSQDCSRVQRNVRR
jgi:hypothetical protein